MTDTTPFPAPAEDIEGPIVDEGVETDGTEPAGTGQSNPDA